MNVLYGLTSGYIKATCREPVSDGAEIVGSVFAGDITIQQGAYAAPAHSGTAIESSPIGSIPGHGNEAKEKRGENEHSA